MQKSSTEVPDGPTDRKRWVPLVMDESMDIVMLTISRIRDHEFKNSYNSRIFDLFKIHKISLCGRGSVVRIILGYCMQFC